MGRDYPDFNSSSQARGVKFTDNCSSYQDGRSPTLSYLLLVRDELQLQCADLSDLNDRLLYASLTLYGKIGPDASKTCKDDSVAADDFNE